MTAESKALHKNTRAGWVKWFVVTLVIAVVALIASPNGPLGAFWRPAPVWGFPTSAQLPFFILLNIAEVIAFGLGVSFLLFGYPLLRPVAPTSKSLTLAAYFSIVWLLANWWPHDSLHAVNGVNLTGLLAIEYVFHVTLMMTGAILAYFFLALLRQQTKVSH